MVVRIKSNILSSVHGVYCIAITPPVKHIGQCRHVTCDGLDISFQDFVIENICPNLCKNIIFIHSFLWHKNNVYPPSRSFNTVASYYFEFLTMIITGNARSFLNVHTTLLFSGNRLIIASVPYHACLDLYFIKTCFANIQFCGTFICLKYWGSKRLSNSTSIKCWCDGYMTQCSIIVGKGSRQFIVKKRYGQSNQVNYYSRLLFILLSPVAVL